MIDASDSHSDKSSLNFQVPIQQFKLIRSLQGSQISLKTENKIIKWHLR